MHMFVNKEVICAISEGQVNQSYKENSGSSVRKKRLILLFVGQFSANRKKETTKSSFRTIKSLQSQF